MIRRRIDRPLFFIHRIAAPQTIRPYGVRLPKKVKPLPSLKSHIKSVARRLLVENNVIFKMLIV
jgi:hypothetical protein